MVDVDVDGASGVPVPVEVDDGVPVVEWLVVGDVGVESDSDC